MFRLAFVTKRTNLGKTVRTKRQSRGYIGIEPIRDNRCWYT